MGRALRAALLAAAAVTAPVAAQTIDEAGTAPATAAATRAAATRGATPTEVRETGDRLEGRMVSRVEVIGNTRTPTEAILPQLRVQSGQAYARAQVEVDLRILASLQKFNSVRGEVILQADGGVVVRYVVEERPTINAVQITGSRRKKDEDLRELMVMRAGSTFDAFSVEQDRQAMLNSYKKDGYVNVRIDYDKKVWDEQGILRWEITEGAKTRIRGVKFEGNTHIKSDYLKWKLTTKSYFWFFQPGLVDEDTLDADMAIIRDQYLRRGYLDVRVSRSLEYSGDKSRVTIRFIVDEGPRYRIGKIDLTGNAVFPEWELRGDMAIRPGDFVERDAVERSQRRIEDRYGHEGYIYRKVDITTSYSETPGVVDVKFNITEGNAYTVGQVIIRGNQNIQDRVVRRHIRIFPDQTFDSVLVKKSIDRLKAQRIYSDVSIKPVGDDPTVRDALIEVQEGQTGRFSVGAGVSTNTGLVGQLSIEQQNFDITNWPRSAGEFLRGQSFKGAGQYFRILLEPGTELQRYRLTFEEPSLFDTVYGFANDLFYFTRERESWNERRIGDVMTISRRFSDVWLVSMGFRVEQVEIDDYDDFNRDDISQRGYFLKDKNGKDIGPFNDTAQDVIDQRGSHFLTSIKPAVVRDTTDSRVFPTTGSRASLAWEQYGAMGGDVTMSKIVGRFDWYYPLYTDLFDRKTVFVNRNEVGVIPFGDSPFYERFYGGGIGSLRGFRFRGVSPRQGGQKDPIGGDFSWVSTAEVNFPIFEEILRGVVFVDVGTVERDITVSSIRSDIGFGFRITIPFFGQLPLALDFAVPITKSNKENDRTQVVSFSLGLAY